jgi:hypothetical protein
VNRTGGGGGGKVGEEEQVAAGQELDHLAELVRVAAGGGVVAEFALAGAGGVEGEEVPLDGGEGGEDGFAALVEFGWGWGWGLVWGGLGCRMG